MDPLCPAFTHIQYGQVEQLKKHILVWEDSPVFYDFPNDSIETFNRISGVNKLPHLSPDR